MGGILNRLPTWTRYELYELYLLKKKVKKPRKLRQEGEEDLIVPPAPPQHPPTQTLPLHPHEQKEGSKPFHTIYSEP